MKTKNLRVLLVGIFGLGVFIGSCAPRDNHVKTLKQRLLEGEVYTINSKGEAHVIEANGSVRQVGTQVFRLPTCYSDNDWQDLRVHKNDYKEFVLGTGTLFIANGYQNCQRIGNRVYIDSNDVEANGSLGYADIAGLALMSLDRLPRAQEVLSRLSVRPFSIEKFNDTYERLSGSTLPKHQGIVQVTFAKYVGGTSVLESKFKKELQQQNSLEAKLMRGEVVTLDQPGQILETCNGQAWEDMRIHHSQQNAVIDGGIKTLIKRGGHVCHVVDQIIPIRLLNKNQNEVEKVQIKKIQLMSLDKLKSNKDWVLGDVAQESFESDVQRIEKELTDQKNKIVSLVHFERVGE